MRESENYSEEDIDRLKLYPDGEAAKKVAKNNRREKVAKWERSEYLPQDWTCQKVRVGSNAVKIKTDCGQIFNSHFDATLFMNLDPAKYSKEDVEKLNLYPNGEPHIKLPQRSQDEVDEDRNNPVHITGPRYIPAHANEAAATRSRAPRQRSSPTP